MSLPKIDTFPAGSFICAECGHQNFYPLVPIGEGESKKFATEMMEIQGYPKDVCDSGSFLVEPDCVSCSECFCEFEPCHEDF